MDGWTEGGREGERQEWTDEGTGGRADSGMDGMKEEKDSGQIDRSYLYEKTHT